MMFSFSCQCCINSDMHPSSLQKYLRNPSENHKISGSYHLQVSSHFPESIIIFFIFNITPLFLFSCYINSPCDHAHPTAIRIDAFFFRYKFDDIFSVLESMIHSKILKDHPIITSIDAALRYIDLPLHRFPCLHSNIRIPSRTQRTGNILHSIFFHCHICLIIILHIIRFCCYLFAGPAFQT